MTRALGAQQKCMVHTRPWSVSIQKQPKALFGMAKEHQRQSCRLCICKAQKQLQGDINRLLHVRVEDEYTQDVLRFHDDGASLEDYISLPVSQYVLIDLPLGAQLTRLGSNKFQIDVSKLELAGVYVRPSVQCLVRNDKGYVDIESTDLDIQTSSHMEFLRLRECVDFRVCCQLRPVVGDGVSKIVCTSQITADVAPPSFFAFIPNAVLLTTANAALKTSLSTLQSTFVRALARDYENWATSSNYREERRKFTQNSDGNFV